ncbi:MAG: N-acetylmuramoyl-L-alanine amidase [Cyanobacteria bacterium SZAS-4]|nr:N-acetylmuramoyl-L-alanine amidase [Cyanobacteria bacterium SZAS-4]
MKLNLTVFAALSLLAIAVSNVAPAEALVGRLSSHSIGAVRRLQQAATRTAHSHSRARRTASRSRGSKGLRLSLSKHKHGKGKRIAHGAMSPSYLWNAPNGETSLLDEETKAMIDRQFHKGNSQEYSTPSLIQANVFAYCPLHGGVFKRHSAVKNIILHSTETAREADAQRVISSWNNKGLRHAGAQFVVDRNGVIYCTADPEYGTTHVDNRRTRNGVNNDNSIGIEIVRTGTQEYSAAQMNSVVCLVRYLQNRFTVADNHVLGHGQVQPSDRSDPVNFNWQAFAADKQALTGTAYAPVDE